MISKLLTNEYDGTITFESELHVGTEFVFNLKLQTKEEVEISRTEARRSKEDDDDDQVGVTATICFARKTNEAGELTNPDAMMKAKMSSRAEQDNFFNIEETNLEAQRETQIGKS